MNARTSAAFARGMSAVMVIWLPSTRMNVPIGTSPKKPSNVHQIGPGARMCTEAVPVASVPPTPRRTVPNCGMSMAAPRGVTSTEPRTFATCASRVGDSPMLPRPYTRPTSMTGIQSRTRRLGRRRSASVSGGPGTGVNAWMMLGSPVFGS
jgi:hypothetical protein